MNTYLFVNAREHYRHQERTSTVAYGPAGHTKCVSLGSEPCGKDLGRINKWDQQPRRTEDQEVDKNHGCSCSAVLSSFVWVVNRSPEEAADNKQGNTILRATAPQYRVRRRPTLSMVKAAMAVPRMPTSISNADSHPALTLPKPTVR